MADIRDVVASLDEVSDAIENRGHKDLASEIDRVSNQLDEAVKASVAKSARKPVKATPSRQVVKPRKAGEGDPPPGSDDAMDWEHQDAYEAKNYHKIPVGKDSLSKAIGRNLPDLVSDLDFAQHTSEPEGQEINVQASRKAAMKKFTSPENVAALMKAGRMAEAMRAIKLASRVADEMDVDLGDAGDDHSTSALPESGDETQNPPLDENQEGSDLQFFGTYEAGDGPDPGHHGPSASRRRRQAERTLRVAMEPEAPVIVEPPSKLMTSEEGEDVERDQELGGMTAAKRSAAVDVRLPKFVPTQVQSVWYSAAQNLADAGKLIRSGKVDYPAIRKRYAAKLTALSAIAQNGAKPVKP